MARVTAFCGRYGSGKTEVAINYACRLAAAGGPVTLVDLDLVTPYFRCRDVGDLLAARGVTLVAPATLGRYSETVGLTPEILGAIQNPAIQVVLDVGGDEIGTRALARYSDYLAEAGCQLYLVVNPFRPATATTTGIAEAAAGIERTARLPISGLVSNPNLVHETTLQHVVEGHATVVQAARTLGLPIVFLCVEASLLHTGELLTDRVEVLPLERHLALPWQVAGAGPANGAKAHSRVAVGPLRPAAPQR